MRPTVLVLVHLDADSRALLVEHFDVYEALSPDALQAAIAQAAERIGFLLTNGATGVDAQTIAQLPALRLIGALGAGYENVALDAARQRGIQVVNGRGTNASCVADHAFALLLAIVRDIPHLDSVARAGTWRDGLPFAPQLSGKRLGIVGLGAIGAQMAKRALGFDLEVGYHNRRQLSDSPHRYFETVSALAEWADYLVAATPGGAETRHLIDAKVLDALGPHGFLVNVGRGSVVDTAALVSALRSHAIAGAALDVYEGEPVTPPELIPLKNLVLTPHIGGRSPEAVGAAFQLFVKNVLAYCAGEPLLTPVE
ncbi:MAG: 2-hydroxyacid dehydrogenase [Janthinobacterium lividum]